MKIVAHFHMAAPEHGAGAEWMAQAILAYMVRHGHEATILAAHAQRARTEHQGVEILGAPTRDEVHCAWDWADVAVTHLDMSVDAQLLAVEHGTPLVHLVHNDMQLAANGVNPGTAQLVVFNSHWLRQANAWWGSPSLIVHPPVTVAEYEGCAGGEMVTLINLSAAKGASTFYDAARTLTHRRFLGVLGTYGAQMDHGSGIELIGNVPDVRVAYRRTRVLLMPSWYESWGRCAIEAACSGIPTIAEPTPGLVEALGGAGLFCDRNDVNAVCDLIERCYDEPAFYKRAARSARRRALQLGRLSQVQLAELERSMTSLVGVVPTRFEYLHPSQQGWSA